MLTINQIKNRLGRKFSGASIDDIQGVSDYTLFVEAANNLLSKIDPAETVRKNRLNLFKEIYDYTAPSDLKRRKVIDIRPQTGRNTSDNFRQAYIEDIDRDKNDKTFSVEYDEGTKFMRIVDRTLTGAIQVTDSDSDNWTAGTGVSNITEDTVNYSEGGKSIRFDVSSGQNLLTWAGTAVDLSDHTNKSTFFMWIYLPDSSIISSIKLRVGSDASNYYEITGSLQRGSVKDGWNLYKFEWDGVSDAGTTDEENVDYVRLEITTTSADTDLYIGVVTSKFPYPHEIVYYSEALFKSSAGTYLSIPTANTDVLQLDSDAENLFFYECCELAASDLGDTESMIKFDLLLNGDGNESGLYSEYNTDQPSEAIRPQTQYYKLRKHHLGR